MTLILITLFVAICCCLLGLCWCLVAIGKLDNVPRRNARMFEEEQRQP